MAKKEKVRNKKHQKHTELSSPNQSGKQPPVADDESLEPAKANDTSVYTTNS
jgi:hypothetical protein